MNLIGPAVKIRIDTYNSKYLTGRFPEMHRDLYKAHAILNDDYPIDGFITDDNQFYTR